MTRARVWIGDWLRAWRALGDAATAADAASLAAMCDLAVAAPPAEKWVPPMPQESVSSPSRAPAEPVRPKSLPSTVVEPTDERSIRIEPLPKIHVAVSAATGEGLAPVASELPRRELQPLFRREITRNLLSAAAATWRPEGPIAMKVLVDDVARRKPVVKLPRRAIPTLRVGAVLLVSKVVAEPFAADLVDLRQQLRRIVGTAAVAEWWLGEDLTLRPRLPQPAPWPPSAGTPVIAVAASSERLEILAGDLARVACPLLAIIPGRGVSTPARNLTVIGWDHRTRVSDIVRAKRQAERR